MARSGFRYNPAVFCDPQVIPELVPLRGRGRPTLYSQDLVDEFCGLIVEGMTIDRACKEGGMPSKRTIGYWLKKYPEFRREFEEAVFFRNALWMDDCVDIAGDVTGAPTADRKLICDQRWKRYNGMRLKGLKPETGDNAKLVGKDKPKIVERDPAWAQLYQWEIAYQKRQAERANSANGRANGHSNGQATARADR
jgi:hypothetical protein